MITFERLQLAKEMTTQLAVYQIISISKIIIRSQQELDADPKAIQQINSTENLDSPANRTMFFIVEEAKEAILDFSQRTVQFLLL